MTEKIVLAVLLCCFLIIPGLFIIQATYCILRDSELQKSGLITEGEIVEAKFYRNGTFHSKKSNATRRGSFHEITIKYKDHKGHEHKLIPESRINLKEYDYKIGSKIKILYNKNYPQKATINLESETGNYIFIIGIASIPFLLGLAILKHNFNRFIRKINMHRFS